jgi:hypothetical protein
MRRRKLFLSRLLSAKSRAQQAFSSLPTQITHDLLGNIT